MLSANASSLKSLGRALRQSEPQLYREVQKALRAEGQKIAERAKANASWSTQIPGSIKVSSSGLNAIKIRATARDAGPYEHAGAQGTFRHPVFGNRDVWVDQQARPFLHPAALQHLDESARAIAEALTVKVDQIIHGQEVSI